MKAIILAGGAGSRLWPLSREEYPKQLLKLNEDNSLLQNTFLRLRKLVEPENIIAVTNVKHFSDVKMQLNSKEKNVKVLAEPMGRNTAPAIACAIEYFSQIDNNDDDIVLIVPSDSLIKNVDAFCKTVKKAEKLAQNGYIVTFGIKPYFPETGYGYVKTAEALEGGFKVDSFVEKPNRETAEIYLKQGNYYWNGGMFMAKISTLKNEFQRYAAEICVCLKDLKFDKDASQIKYSVYEQMPNISIDYAIMEKSEKIALVELLSDWDDLGSWQAIYKEQEKDENDNVISGNVITNNVKNSLVFSQKELVAVSDLENVIVVETEDAILACDINKTQNVKVLYERLKQSGSETVQMHKTVFRPWGYYTCQNAGEGYLTKVICVLPKQKLSIQSHNHRSEHWVVLEGTATIILEDKEITCKAGDSIDIPVKAKHSLQNHTDRNLKIIEVQKGDYIGEDDIIRYNDIYGRV